MSRANAVVTTQHPMLRQLDLLAEHDVVEAHAPDLDVSYMTRSLCPSALPLRKQYERNKETRKTAAPQKEVSVFRRTDSWFAVSVATEPFPVPTDNGVELFDFGLPYGARGRLLLLWMAAQCRLPGRQPGSRYLEIGRISEWLESVGIASNPDSVSAAKEQLIRLSAAKFSISVTDKSRTRHDSYTLMDSVVFGNEDLRNYRDGKIGQVRFPLGLKLSTRAYEEFTGQGVIPVSTQALRSISNNAMAIDFYLYMSYLLPMIAPGESRHLTWKMLSKQFGSDEPPSRFRTAFKPSLEKALTAYVGAKVDISDEGVTLYHSPIEPRKLFAVSSAKATGTLLRIRRSNRITLDGDEE